MESPIHSFSSLFEQLGLDGSDRAVDAFVDQHRGSIPEGTPLWQAGFWSPSQSAFLCEALQQDADWAEVVDQLDAMLRGGSR